MMGQELQPNAETLEAFDELENGGGHVVNGSTEDLIAELMEDQDFFGK